MIAKLRESAWLILAAILIAIGIVIFVLLIKLCPIILATAGNLQASTQNTKNATWNLSAVTYAAKKFQEDPVNREFVRKTRSQIFAATGETTRTLKHIAKASQDYVDQQQRVADVTVGAMDNLTRNVDEIGRQTTADLQTLNTDLVTLRYTLDGINGLVTDPSLKAVITNTDNLAYSSSLLVHDFQLKAHEILFPTPYNGRFKKLHAAYTVGRGLVQYAPPANAVNELINGISVNIKK